MLNLRGKLIVIGIVAIVLLFSAIGAFRIHQEKANLEEQMARSEQARLSMIGEALANLLVAYDYSNIESLAARIVKQQDVMQIKVLNRSGKVVTLRQSSALNPQQQGFVFTAPVVFSGAGIGSVELTISPAYLEQSMRTTYRNVIVTILLATVFFSSLIYTIISVFVVTPLMRLSKAADQLAIGDYSAALPPVSQDEMGNLIRAFASMRESRKHTEVRLLAIFENSPDAFIQLDADGNITDWNDHAGEIWGYQKNEVLGKNFSMVMPTHELGLNDGYRKCYQKTENIIGVIREVVGQRKDGSLFPLELRTSEINLEAEVSYLVSARDITERKESELQLLGAMNAAEAANAAKSAFLSNMSHEIRTPMNSIMGMTNLAFKTHLTAKQHDYLSKIDYAAHHLLDLINDILDFSKIEANKLELDIQDFKLDKVFENLANQLTHSAMLKGLGISFILDPALTEPVRGDPLRLTQVLLNYTSNAIKFTDKGEITILAIMQEEGADDFVVRFEVRDTGIGLSAAEIGKLFQAFHQADASTTRKYGGTGLGLAISKQLVELMGGSVGVESQPHAGSTFWFVVRLPRGSDMETKPVTPPLDLGILRQASILLVEDNLFNQQVAVEMLREVGCGVSIANNGQEAIEMLLKRHFDCVLMDVQMPVMDGLEATRRIRVLPALADTYIVAMTANAGREDRERCHAAGMNGFIGKPVFAGQLYALLAQHMLTLAGASHAAAGTGIKEASAAVQNAGVVPGNSGQASVIDLSLLGRMMGSDPVKIRKFAFKFLHSAQAGLDEIRQALQQENWAQLAALGHRNKSPARTVGAQKLADLCLSLESFKNGGDAEQVQKIVAQMDELLQQIAKEINSEMA